MKKHIWISGMKISLIEERNDNFRNLAWVGEIPSSYSVHVFQNENNDGGIIACSDAFGGRVAWARYTGKNNLIGKEYSEFFEDDEKQFLRKSYPAFLEAVESI